MPLLPALRGEAPCLERAWATDSGAVASNKMDRCHGWRVGDVGCLEADGGPAAPFSGHCVEAASRARGGVSGRGIIWEAMPGGAEQAEGSCLALGHSATFK